MTSSSTTTAAVMAALLLLTSAITVTEAQGGGTANTPSCASKLVPCAQYIGNSSATPPKSCCDPIKETVRTELACLCNLYNTPGFLASLGINVTQALGLTTRCGISADTSSCSRVAAQPPAGSTVPAPPTRATDPNSGSSKMAWTGLSSLLLTSFFF